MARKVKDNNIVSRNKRNKKISIILSNYCSEEYLNEAIESVFKQDYTNIELIITDDGSPNFKKSIVEKYIKENKTTNISDVKYVINKENIGTVKTFNKALKEATGEYIMFFACDDKLFDSSVISNFIKTFDEKKDVNVVTSNWILCDSNLNRIGHYQKPRDLKRFNNKKVKKQYKKLCKINIYGAGSTCYRRCIFEKYGFFDEKYFLLEDWPYWVMLTKNNERIYYSDFDSLLHRSGGVSTTANAKEAKMHFCNDILTLFAEDIVPYIDSFDSTARFEILDAYKHYIKEYSSVVDTSKYKQIVLDYYKKHCVKKYLDDVRPNFIKKYKILIRRNKVVPVTFFIEILVLFLVNNLTKLFNNRLVILPFIIITYIILFYIVCTLSAIKEKRSN